MGMQYASGIMVLVQENKLAGRLGITGVRHQTRSGKQDDGDELCNNSKGVPVSLVVLFGSVLDSCGKEGLPCDEEGGNDQEDINGISRTEFVAGTITTLCWEKGEERA